MTTTVAAGDRGCSAASRCAIIGCPAIGCMTLGMADFIRVPLPAARMMAANRDWLIGGSKQIQNETGGTITRRRLAYNTQIITKCSTNGLDRTLVLERGRFAYPAKFSSLSICDHRERSTPAPLSARQPSRSEGWEV